MDLLECRFILHLGTLLASRLPDVCAIVHCVLLHEILMAAFSCIFWHFGGKLIHPSKIPVPFFRPFSFSLSLIPPSLSLLGPSARGISAIGYLKCQVRRASYAHDYKRRELSAKSWGGERESLSLMGRQKREQVSQENSDACAKLRRGGGNAAKNKQEEEQQKGRSSLATGPAVIVLW